MNLDQYESLLRVCDSILLTNQTEAEGVAIPWLHILNEHPANLSRYEHIFQGQYSSRLVEIKSAIRTMLNYKVADKSSTGWTASSELPPTLDVLFVSHLVNAAQIGAKEDFYFGTLPETVASHGMSSLIVLHDHTGGNSHDISGRWPKTCVPRLLFNRALSWSEEIGLRRRLRHQSQRMRTIASQETSTLKRDVLLEASRQAMSSHSIATLRFFMQIAHLASQLRPRTVLVTYEGHAWERLTFAAARQAVPNVKCIGYHHAILFPRQHAIMRSLGGHSDPDVILTSGEITRDVLAQAPGLQSTRIEVVGTPRFEPPQSDLAGKLSGNAQHSCLVIPDGTLSECLLILDFAVAAAKLKPSLNFLIRMHPAIAFKHVAAANPAFKNLPRNVEISTQSIRADLSRSRWALYRGSGAVIHAVIAGLRPFYLSANHELCIDPIHQLQAWRKTATGPASFVSELMLDFLATDSDLLEEWQAARNYCLKYFQSFDLEKSLSIIQVSR